MRAKLPGEITPITAEQSSTAYNSEKLFGAAKGIDGDLDTQALIFRSKGPWWYRVKFLGVKCINQVQWLHGKTGTPVMTWDCNESGCGNCHFPGGSTCPDGRFLMIASTERGSTDGLPRPSGCVYGDTFELSDKPVEHLHLHEIAFIGKDVEGTAIGVKWRDCFS
jgi:hypothetical protein